MTERAGDGREVPAYLLRRPSCGHVVGVCVDGDDKLSRREAAKFCAEGIRSGLTVERTTVGAVRDQAIGEWCLSTCRQSPHHPKPERPKRQMTLPGSEP